MRHKSLGTEINIYQNDGKGKVWRKKRPARDPKRTSSSVKHGGGSAMAWDRMAASITGPIIFLSDDGIHDGSSRINPEIFFLPIYSEIYPILFGKKTRST